MARMKKTSKVLESARTRLAAVRSIDPTLDLGNGVSTVSFESKINEANDFLRSYNTTLSHIDELLHAFEVSEVELSELHERVLLSVASRYGKNSIEYVKAGGTRKTHRKRPRRPVVETT